MKNCVVSSTIFLSFLFFSSQTLQAQQNPFGNSPFQVSQKTKDKNADENDNNGKGNPHNQPFDAPIDGGIGILLAGGIVYGFKKVRDRQQYAKAQAEK